MTGGAEAWHTWDIKRGRCTAGTADASSTETPQDKNIQVNGVPGDRGRQPKAASGAQASEAARMRRTKAVHLRRQRRPAGRRERGRSSRWNLGNGGMGTHRTDAGEKTTENDRGFIYHENLGSAMVAAASGSSFLWRTNKDVPLEQSRVRISPRYTSQCIAITFFSHFPESKETSVEQQA